MKEFELTFNGTIQLKAEDEDSAREILRNLLWDSKITSWYNLDISYIEEVKKNGV